MFNDLLVFSDGGFRDSLNADTCIIYLYRKDPRDYDVFGRRERYMW